MSDPTGHFFHDMIEGVVIWEDAAQAPATPPIDVPAEAGSVGETHVDHVDPTVDAADHGHSAIEALPVDSDAAGLTIASADHAHDAMASEPTSADASHDGDATA